MNEPKSNDKKDIEDFLIYCSRNQKIYLWNKWRSSTKFNDIDLSFMKLQRSYLGCANLNEINLQGADLRYTYLEDANLKFSNLSNSKLQGANLWFADLQGADISNANFEGADLQDANLQGTKIIGTKFDYKYQQLFHTQPPDLNDGKSEISTRIKQAQIKIDNLEKMESQSSVGKNNSKHEIEKLKQTKKLLWSKLQIINDKKNQETKDIREIIKYLSDIPEEISSEQRYLKISRRIFVVLAYLTFIAGIFISIRLAFNVLDNNPLQLPKITNIGHYLSYALSVAFPMVLSFLFHRQANIKSKEIEKINQKSIIIQQVENALKSYNVLLNGDALKEKTIGSIDQVLNKLFGNNHQENAVSKIKESKISVGDIHKLTKIIGEVTKH